MVALIVALAGCSQTDDDAQPIDPTTSTADSAGQATGEASDESPSDDEQPAATAIEVTNELEESEPTVEEEEETSFTEEVAEGNYLEDAPEFEQLAMVESSCSEVAGLYLDAYQSVLDLLGDADRDNTERIDFALDQFGSGGQLLQARLDELDCDGPALDAAACAAVGRLEATGPVGEDMIANVSRGC